MSSLFGQRKTSVIARSQTHKKDTGSPDVQIAIISQRIEDLTKHFEVHKKDHGSRHGLLKLVGHRRRLLAYLKGVNQERYTKLIGELGIRK